MRLVRRDLLVTGAALALMPRIAAAAPRGDSFPLWPGAAPGAPATPVRDSFVLRSPQGSADDIAWTHVARPTLTVTRPMRANGAAVLLLPGGGYARVALRRGGSEIASMFAERGFTAFDLLYRLPHDGWAAGPDAPLQDAQRAMRLIRARAAEFGIDPARVAALGFSAGGHLAARLGSRSRLATYAEVDRADRQSARPLLLGLYFPVVTLVGPAAHKQSREELLGAGADEARARAVSADADLADMPPTYLACAADDPVVDPVNSLSLFSALRAGHVPAELMVFEKGGHGFPPPDAAGRPYPWLDLFLRFAARHGLQPFDPGLHQE
jgi:acetyl esterase/lipase